MSASLEEFISSFHGLEGITIGERKRNLFKLLNKNHHFLESKSSELSFLSLIPRTPLEENFKVDVLIYFKRIPELLKVLKSENPILIGKILKNNSWFIEEAFKDISGQQLVLEIFPNLSFNTKVKLLNKLSLHVNNTQKADEYFEAIKENYNLYLASKLLPGCSENLLTKYLDSYRIEITPGHLLSIIKKYPSLTENIFKKFKFHNDNIDLGKKYKHVFVYLIKHDFQFFFVLMKQYKPQFTLGLRATKTLIGAQKQIITEKPKQFRDFLKVKQLYRSLKQDFKEFFCKLLPRSIKQFKEQFHVYMSLLYYLPSDAVKLDVLLTAAKRAYGKEFYNNTTLMVPEVIKMMSVEDRNVWIETHVRPKDVDESTWTSFSKTEKSLPLLRARFSHASIKQRANLLTCLVKSCKINKDKMALTEVLKFVLQHRNDHVSVQNAFLDALNDSYNAMDLEKQHWEHISKYLLFYRLNHDDYTWGFSRVSEKYIYYCCEKELPVKEALTEWLKLRCCIFNMCCNKPEHEKHCLLIFSEIIPSVYKDEELNFVYVDYLDSVVKFNRRNPRNAICLFRNKSALDCAILNLQKETYKFIEESIATACILQDYDKAKELNLLHMVLSGQSTYHRPKLINYLIKQRPLIILDYIEPLLLKNCGSSLLHNFCYRNYAHLGIPQKISEICLKLANSEQENNIQKRRCAVAILSKTLEPNAFLNFVGMYRPSELKPNIENKEGQNTYEIHQTMLYSLKNVIPGSLALKCVLCFCKGDYLKFTVVPLYRISHNVSECKLPSFLNALSKHAVSARKHSVQLAFNVLDKSKANNLIREVMESDKNPSIQCSLLKVTFNFCIKNPDDSSWNLAKSCIKTVNHNDEETLQILTQCRKMPKQYYIEYVLFLWDILEEFSGPSDIIVQGKCDILKGLDAITVTTVPKVFCKNIIDKYLFKSNELSDLEKAVQYFICKFLIYCKSECDQKECMNLVFMNLEKYIEATWHDINKNTNGRKTVSHFIEEFCSDFKSKKCCNVAVLKLFINMWTNLLKPCGAFDEYLNLQFTFIYVNYLKEKETAKYLGKEIALLCDNLQQSIVISIFVKFFELFEDNFLSDDLECDVIENRLSFIQGILNTSKSSSCLVLVIRLLPLDAMMTPVTKLMYIAVIEALVKMQSKDPIVQINLQHYFKKKQDF